VKVLQSSGSSGRSQTCELDYHHHKLLLRRHLSLLRLLGKERLLHARSWTTLGGEVVRDVPGAGKALTQGVEL
jgi:hypothetical protein